MREGGGRAGLDIETTAEALIHHHGGKAPRIAATRAEKLAQDGDRDGAMEWLSIAEEVVRRIRRITGPR